MSELLLKLFPGWSLDALRAASHAWDRVMAGEPPAAVCSDYCLTADQFVALWELWRGAS